jgi:integrase
MPTLHLTKTVVDRIPFTESGQIFFRDNVVRGFGLRVGRTTKVYFAEAQPNGKTRRVSIGRADVFAPEVARKKAQALLVEMASGMDPNKEKREKRAEMITVSKAFDQMFAAKPNLSASALDNYGRTLRRYLADWADKNIVEITRQMILAKHQKIGEQYGLVTANNAMRHFRSVFNFVAAGFDEFPQNPTVILTQARAWNREKRRTRVISNSDLPQWWKVVMAESDDAQDIMLFALFTGMRRSEIVRLSWENVDLVGKKLHLDKTKNHDPLDLPLCQFLVDLIAQRRERVAQSEWVFPSRNSSTGHIQEVKSFVYRIVGASGIEFSLHDLRRSFVTVAESLDINTYSLKRLLNHRTNADVTHGYVIGNVERLRGPVERVAARILELVNGDAKQSRQTRPADCRTPVGC